MVEIQLDAYLERLKAEEGYQRTGERRQVPTYVDLANESGITPVTLSRITNGHVKQLNLAVLGSIITSLRQRGFATEVSDLLAYQPKRRQEEAPASEMLHSFRDLSAQQLKLRQPSARQKHFELRAEDALLGTLHWPSGFFSLCRAESADGAWILDRKGFFSPRVTARVADSGQDVFLYTTNWAGMKEIIRHVDGREFALRGNFLWGNTFTVTLKQTHGEDVELFSVKIDFYLLRGSADVVIQPALLQVADASPLVLMACYLAVMTYEEMAYSGMM